MYKSLDNQKTSSSWSMSYAERMKQLKDLLTAKLDDESAMIGLSLKPKTTESDI